MQSLLTFIKTDRFKKYFFNTGWMLAERAVSMIILFIVGILIARYLGPNQFGILSYAITIGALVSPLCFLGLEGIIIREIVKDPDETNEIMGTAFTLTFYGCLSALILVVLFTFLIPSDPITRNLLLITASGLIFDCFFVYRYYNQAKVLMKYTAVSSMLSVILASCYRLFLIFHHLNLVWFGVAVIFQKIILTISLHFFYKSSNLKNAWRFSFPRAVSLLKNSCPLLLSSFTVIIYMYIDQAMLMWMKGAETVGQYAVAVKISEVWYYIPSIICSSIFPAVVNLKSNPDLYHKRLLQLYKLMIFISLAITIPISFFAKDIIMILFGDAYLSAANVLKIYVWSSVFVFLGVASGNYLLAENYTQIVFFRSLIGMVLNIALNIILIPYYGITGAAVATVISYSAATFSIIAYAKSRNEGLTMLRAFNIFGKP